MAPVGQEACEPSTVGAGALYAERVNLSQAAGPPLELPRTRRRRRARASRQAGHLARQWPPPHAGPCECRLR